MQVRETPCISVEDISFSYDGRIVLEGVNFSVQRGEYLGIIGPNGGGKTTLIKLILGLLKPNSGVVKIFGVDAARSKDRSLIGYVPQDDPHAAMRFPATVEEVVRSGRTPRLKIFGRYSGHDEKIVENAMTVAGVAKSRNRLIGELSGGERQRVFIARALANESAILILDEPSVGIDRGAQEKFYEFIGALNRENGLTVLFVSHDLDVIAREAKSLLCINTGVVCRGAPGEFMKEEYLEKLYGRRVAFIHHEH